MKDPYEILGVQRADSMEDIKKAYRALTKKYHPDNYVGNDLADLAQEKMKDINEAYESIQRERSGNPGGNARGGWNPSPGGGSQATVRIREALQQGRLPEAQSLLDGASNRDAEWHYLYGVLHYQRGWYDEAARYIEQAAQMEPGNPEYRQAADQMRRGGSRGHSMFGGQGGQCGQNGQGSQCSMCDVCMGMMCLDCLCDCI